MPRLLREPRGGHADHGSRPVNEGCPKVHVPALADTKKRRLAAARMLPWHKSEPGRELPAIGEGLRITNRGHEGRDRADAGYLGKSSALGVLPVPNLNLGFEFVYLAV